MAVVLFALLMPLGISLLSAQTKQTTEQPMKHFVMIFRATRVLSHDEIEQRRVEIQAWVKKATEMKIELYPYTLEQVIANYSMQNQQLETHSMADDTQLSNFVFFDAPDINEAKKIAEMHPGLRYGTKLELREWSSPRAGATAPPIKAAK